MVSLRQVAISSPRLDLRSFSSDDAPEVFAASTPSLTRYMRWDPSPTIDAFAEVWRSWLPEMARGKQLFLVVRSRGSREFLGMAGLHEIAGDRPELGVWIKEPAQGLGYGREAVAAVLRWADANRVASEFTYPVAVENVRSRRLIETLGGRLSGERQVQKASGQILREVVYVVSVPRTSRRGE
jgi:RimJ/RimL family protein N-acetyltransferase